MDKKKVLRDIMAAQSRELVTVSEADRCVVCTLPMAEIDDSGVRRCPQGHKQHYEDHVSPTYALTPEPAATPHKSTIRPPPLATNTYSNLSTRHEHTVRCYITPELVEKAVKKQLHRSNARLCDAETLTLKCSGPGEQYVRIENLGGLSNLKSLTAQNHAFVKLEGLSPLVSLTSLDLSGGRIQKVENISHLVHLRELNLNYNFVESLPGEGVWPLNLSVLRCAGNRLTALDDLHHLRHLMSLEVLDLRDNAMCRSSSYRSIAAYAVLSVIVLDDVEVTDTERNAAIFHWDRKGLKPLQTELTDTKKELEALRRELEDARTTSAHKDGQLNAVSKLLEISHTESDAIRKEKFTVEVYQRDKEGVILCKKGCHIVVFCGMHLMFS